MNTAKVLTTFKPKFISLSHFVSLYNLEVKCLYTISDLPFQPTGFFLIPPVTFKHPLSGQMGLLDFNQRKIIQYDISLSTLYGLKSVLKIDEKTSEILLTNVGREATLFEMHENLELYKVAS